MAKYNKIGQIYTRKRKKFPKNSQFLCWKMVEFHHKKHCSLCVYQYFLKMLCAHVSNSNSTTNCLLIGQGAILVHIFNTLPIALHLLGYIYRVSATQDTNLTKDFIWCSLIVNGENGGHGHYYQNWDLCSDWPQSIYEGKAVCFVLYCNYEIHQTGMLQIIFLVSLESSGGGVHGLGSMMLGLGVQKFLNIEWFFHWKLN